MTLSELCNSITPLNAGAMAQTRRSWDSVAKPLGSLGGLEELVTRIAGITGTAEVDVTKKAVVVFCADNGVVAQGVTQCAQEVTATVARSIARGSSCVCSMAKVAGAQVLAVDMGMAQEVDEPGLLQKCVRRGTGNLAVEPAMSRAEAERAILTGAELAKALKAQGVQLLATGEMGIGNTTTSSAVVSVLLDLPPEQVTGRGAGLSSAGLERKISAIRRGIALHRPNRGDVLEVISRVGGLDMAGMVGLYLGGAAYGVPVLMDGFISAAAALCAVRLCPQVQEYLLPSHQSGEPAARLVMEELGLSPILHAGMRLGEGTGAVALMPLLDMALAVYREAGSFEEIEMEAYTRLL